MARTEWWRVARMLAPALVFACPIISNANAQVRSSSAENELLLAGGVTVVSASKTAQRIGDAPAAVSVITAEDIRRSGATTILDVLRMAPGVDVLEPNRTEADVSIRGFNDIYSNKLLVMVDGRSIYQDFFGSVLWHLNPLPISSIKRIEIVRGPGSALYGANAFNGIINIITKTPEDLVKEHENVYVAHSTGDQTGDISEIRANGGNLKGLTFSVAAEHDHTDGIIGQDTDGNSRDRYTVPVITADFQQRLPTGFLRIAAGSTNAKSDLAARYFTTDGHWTVSNATLTYDEDRTRNPIQIRMSASALRFGDEAGGGDLLEDVGSHTYDYEIQQQHALGPLHHLVYGASYRTYAVNSVLTGPDEHKQQLWGVYAEDEYHLASSTNLFAGLRVDHNSDYGSNASPRISLVHHLTTTQSMRLSYGSAFRAPTISDLFYNYSANYGNTPVQFLGNSNLSPEHIHSFEAGYRSDQKDGFAGVNVFYNRITGLLDWVPTQFEPSPPNPPGIVTEFTRMNVSNAHALGFELEGERRLSRKLTAQLNYSFQDVGKSNDQPVDFSPKHKINLGLKGEFVPGLSGWLAVHYVGTSLYSGGGAPVPVPPYLRIDTSLQYRVPRRGGGDFTVGVSVTNLLNDMHVEVPPTAQPVDQLQSGRWPRTVWFSVSGRL